jgi:hypothetical protein
MRAGWSIFGLALLGILAVSAADIQAQESRWVRELTAEANAEQPGWRWVSAIQSGRTPIVQSEMRVLVGGWERQGLSRERASVDVEIYQVGNIEDAKRWLASPTSHGGWRFHPYEVGDESWLAEHTSGRVTVSFRRYLLVGRVSSDNRSLVDQFVRRIIAYFDAI